MLCIPDGLTDLLHTMTAPHGVTPSATATTITIGVLALQGAFVEHITLLRQAAHSRRLQRLRDAGLSAHTSAVSLGSSDPSTTPADGAHVPSSGAGHGGGAGGVNVGSGPVKADASPTVPTSSDPEAEVEFDFLQVRTPGELERCAAVILPGGESTSISLIAERTGLLEPLRDFVKVRRRPVWGTCAGLILLAEEANRSKDTGQELIGGLDVRVQRNYFGRQVESFEADLSLPFLDAADGGRFHSVFIRAPVVERVLPPSAASAATALSTTISGTVTAPPRQETKAEVEILARLPGRAKTLKDKTTTAEQLGEEGDIVAVKQGNVFGTAFHPELTGDARIHAWWLQEVVNAVRAGAKAA